jgi:tetratricopeptide (TPR) repeat protein
VTLALLTLALALPAVAFAAWPLLARRPALAGGPPDEDDRAVLQTEKLLALRALRELDLDRQAGHVGEADYADLRAPLEARAAAVLRRLDALPVAPPADPRRAAAPAGAPTPWTRQPAVLGAAGAGLLVFGVVLGLLVSRYTAPAPPEPAQPAMAAPPPGAPGADVPAPPGADAGGPPRPLSKEMLEGMLRAAHASLDAGRYREAIAAYQAVLKRDPRNVDAITHLGVILAVAGHHDDALQAFDRALEIDPDYAHALWDKAGVLETRGDDRALVPTLERFVRVASPGADRDRAEERLRAARLRLARGPAAATPGGAAGPGGPEKR